MSRKEWIAVIVVIGLGIAWQIPRHEAGVPADGGDHAHAAGTVGAGGGHSSPVASPAEVAGPYRTIVLEVTGMT